MKPDLNTRVSCGVRSCARPVSKTILVVVVAIALVLPLSTYAQVAAGYSVTNFVTGFAANGSGVGPVGMAFDSAGNLYIAEYATGFLYKFGKSGGTASASSQINSTAIPGSIAGLAFSKDGSLYLARQGAGDVVQVDPTNGAILRTVATGLNLPTAVATDPLSGDLFVSEPLAGAVVRITNFAMGSGTATVYATPGFVDGLSFGPDGTLYAALSGTIGKITGTNSSTPGTVTIYPVSVPTGDGLAVSANPSNLFVYSNRNDGVITKVDLTTNPPVSTNILMGGSRGDFVNVGPDGCLYATQSDRILKVTNSDGSCLAPPLGPLFPTNPVVSSSFSAFCAELERRDDDEKRDDGSGIALHAKFRLAHNSDGIDLASESLALSVGSVSVTIPAGSFKRTRDDAWRFAGVVNSVHIRAVLRALKSPGAYVLTVKVEGAELNPDDKPYTVTLTIGNDSGTTVAWDDEGEDHHHEDD
jgi:streptogramin lyase